MELKFPCGSAQEYDLSTDSETPAPKPQIPNSNLSEPAPSLHTYAMENSWGVMLALDLTQLVGL